MTPPLAASPVLGLLAAALLTALPSAHAGVPTGPAPFPPAARHDNPYVAFEPGAVKVYAGRENGTRVMVIEHHLVETRDFLFDGQPMSCRIVEEKEFEGGALVDASLNFLGEDVDGNVWYFGEISSTYASGAVLHHEGSWLVGGATLPTDPQETVAVAAPMLFMPAHPEVGDVFMPEDLPGEDETIEVLAVGASVGTHLGTLGQALKVRESSLSEGESEMHWIVPGLGVVKSRGKEERVQLLATSLQPLQP